MREPVNSIDIFVPPEFQVNTNTSYAWSSVNNSYANIKINQQPSSDLIAPNWYDVSVSNIGNATRKASWLVPPGNYPHCGGTIWPGSHTVRVFNATAPGVVGRYFFKVFTNGTSIGFRNFPSVVVSADPNPAYISGWIKYGGRNQSSFYNHPLDELLEGTEGGKVCAKGVTDDGRSVEGQAFFTSLNSSYTLYGLAPGRYTLNATAAGYSVVELPNVILKAAQSLDNVDILLEHSPVLSVVVLSRKMKQPEPWGWVFNPFRTNRTMTFEILDNANLTVTARNQTVFALNSYAVFNYNGSRDLDGHIPQETAGYVNGIAPGTYYVRIWVNNYIQPNLLEGVIGSDYVVVFRRNEENRRMDLTLEKSGILKVTVHFANSTQGLLKESAIGEERASDAMVSGAGRLWVEAYDIYGTRWAANYTSVPSARTLPKEQKFLSETASVELTGFLSGRRNYISQDYTRNDYGIPSGTYSIFAYFIRSDGRYSFVQRITRISTTTVRYIATNGTIAYELYPQWPVEHRVTIGDGRSETSLYLLLQGGFNVTVFSTTAQKPFGLMNWKNWKQNCSVIIEIRDIYGVDAYMRFNTTQTNSAIVSATLLGLDDGTYSIYVNTYGYYQRQVMFFTVTRGAIADISVYVVEGVEITVTLVFQKQQIISPIDTFRFPIYDHYGRPIVPVRFEMYDSRMQLVGANATYISNSGARTTFATTLRGFRRYYGNATVQSNLVRPRWSNYYDTTDGNAQNDYGLKPDVYTIKVYVPGYYQKTDPVIDIRYRGGASVLVAMQRMGRLYGYVHTFTERFWNYTRISWVFVDVIGKDMTMGTCALDGFYEVWLTPGSYLTIYSLPSYKTKSLRIQIPDGSDVQMDMQLLPYGK